MLWPRSLHFIDGNFWRKRTGNFFDNYFFRQPKICSLPNFVGRSAYADRITSILRQPSFRNQFPEENPNYHMAFLSNLRPKAVLTVHTCPGLSHFMPITSSLIIE